MKKILIPLLALALLCICLTAPAEGSDAVTMELITRQLQVCTADDPHLAGLLSETGDDSLPVLVFPVKKHYDLEVRVTPSTVKNKKFTLSVEDEEVMRVNGRNVSGLKAGETVLTITSEEDPSVTLRYRILVIQPANRIILTPSVKTVAAGDTMTLSAEVVPGDASVQSVIWSSEDETIATVDENGNVTALKKGNARFTASAADGSKVHTSVNIRVTQKAEQIELDRTEMTVDAGKSGVLKATVLPKNTDDKNVVWTSSNESVATVNGQGRVTGVALGDCEIICTDKLTGTVEARATVHVQQPVTKISFDQDRITVYAGDTQQLNFTVLPADASNPAIQLTSSNPKVLTVNSEDGTVTGVAAGEVNVDAVSTDGSNRRARIRVKVLQHVTGVHMLRRTAYIDVGQTSTTRAVLEPEKATDNRMTWETADPSVATVSPVDKEPHRVKITGVREGETVVTGTTVDGGFQASIPVRVGDWEHSLKIKEAHVEGADAVLTVQNVSDLYITSITVEVSVFDYDGNPVPCNSKDGSATYTMVYRKTLEPGATTKVNNWKTVNFKLPESLTVTEYVVKITEFEIDHDWVKVIRKKNQPTKKCPVHI